MNNPEDLYTIARNMLRLSKKQGNDEMANLLSRIGDSLLEYDTLFGPKNINEVASRAGTDINTILKAMKYSRENT